jgi:hypothetical protein
MRVIIELEKKHKAEVAVYIIMPMIMIFFIPIISAILPKGSMKTTTVSWCAVDTQFNRMASALNSRLMTGRATFRPLSIKAIKNRAREAVSRAIHGLSVYIFDLAGTESCCSMYLPSVKKRHTKTMLKLVEDFGIPRWFQSIISTITYFSKLKYK